MATPDMRPAVVFDHVEDLTMTAVNLADGNPPASAAKPGDSATDGSPPIMRFVDVKDALVTGCRALTAATTFLQVEGKTTGDIVLDGGNLSKVTNPVSLADDVPKSAVKLRA